MVDSLFVFVVQEDKSYFKFEDRINMVNLGVNQLKNVFVLPSGQYILSQETFKQYFEKDVVSNIEDMDYDLHIFGMFVASKLNIKVRFVGEELTDKVTAKYNDTMKKILPNYSVSVHEIPRKKNEDGLTISASIVRNMLKNKEYEKIMQFVPNSTYTYLQQMGLIQK